MAYRIYDVSLISQFQGACTGSSAEQKALNLEPHAQEKDAAKGGPGVDATGLRKEWVQHVLLNIVASTADMDNSSNFTSLGFPGFRRRHFIELWCRPNDLR